MNPPVIYDSLFLGQPVLRSARRPLIQAFPRILCSQGQIYDTVQRRCIGIPCVGGIVVAEGHSHGLIDPEHDPPTQIIPAYLGTTIAIPRSAVAARVEVSYQTTIDDSHSHTLTFTADELTSLLAGATIRKTTSRNRKQGGTIHSHGVEVKCGSIFYNPFANL